MALNEKKAKISKNRVVEMRKNVAVFLFIHFINLFAVCLNMRKNYLHQILRLRATEAMAQI